MSSTWKNNISFTVFGESHGPAIGVCMDNVPPGESIDVDKIYKFMARRAPKKDGTTTMRKESDIPQIISGYHNGKTTGTPLVAMIANNDQHSQDYNNISKLARPGHADYTGALRYRGFNDIRGGGHFSGRLTAPLCFAGAVAQQILEKRGIYIGAHIAEIHGITDKSFDPIVVSGANGSLPHGVPTERAIRDGEFVTMDFGCVCHGYCSDMTRTVAVGHVTDEMRRIYDTVLSAQLTGIETARAGVTGKDVDAAARDVITKAGYGEYFAHSFGHGVGVEIHEYPNASSLNEKPLPAGAVISAEPGIYIPGKLGVRIEDVIVITETGRENLMKAPKELLIL